MLIIYPLSFGDYTYDYALLYGDFLQKLCLFVCTLIYIVKPSRRTKSCLMLMCIYGVYTQVASLLFTNITSICYTMESIIFLVWAMLLMLRTEYVTAKTIDRNNILLAFYKGEKGSFIMNFFELFGLPVKSMCILAGDKALYLKANKNTFQFGSSSKIHKKREDYVIVDTGVPYTDNFIKEMEKHSNILASKGVFRVRCIEAVSDLLGLIGDDFKPRVYLPSLYLRGII